MSDGITREPYRNAWYDQLQKAVKEHEEDIASVQADIENLNDDVSALETRVDDVEDKTLPDVTSADEGKTVIVNANGEWELGTISGGNIHYTEAEINIEGGSN